MWVNVTFMYIKCPKRCDFYVGKCDFYVYKCDFCVYKIFDRCDFYVGKCDFYVYKIFPPSGYRCGFYVV